ncbi:MAG: cyclic nucleotide-binding domain-containing protein, partial [Bdellovibrionales bacterium]|nr:cyclic nucleotide-binding domain-containing protein [Bdellovibrionales bacterium]
MTEKNVLQNVYLFKGLNSDQLALLSGISRTTTYNPNDEIFGEGDVARAAYFVKYGSVRIVQRTRSGENMEVASLGTGSHFGEMAFLDNEKRSATAIAIEKSEIVEVPYNELKVLLDSNPIIAVIFYHELAHFLAGRLRITT